MHDIMQLAGVPGGSMYYHFPTKKSLGLAVIREAVAQSIEETWIVPVRAASSAKDGVLKVFSAVADQIERDRRGVSGCPLNNLTIELSLADAEFQSALREVFDAWTSAIAERIRRDIHDRKVRGIDANETAVAIVASFSGAMALAKAAQRAGPIKTCARQVGHLFEVKSRRIARQVRAPAE
jgi:AcrR family transcriptional regulator